MDTMEIDWRQSTDHGSSIHVIDSHLVFQSKSLQEAGLMLSIHPASIRSTCQVMYSSQEQIFREDSIESFTRTRVCPLYCLLQPCPLLKFEGKTEAIVLRS